jgi:hypothetical protein
LQGLVRVGQVADAILGPRHRQPLLTHLIGEGKRRRRDSTMSRCPRNWSNTSTGTWQRMSNDPEEFERPSTHG